MGDVLDKKYILALDVGSTTIRCHVLNKQAESLGAGTDKVSWRMYVLSQSDL